MGWHWEMVSRVSWLDRHYEIGNRVSRMSRVGGLALGDGKQGKLVG